FCAIEAHDALVAVAELKQSVNVDALRVVKAAVVLRNSDYLITGVRHELGGVGADVAKTLHNDAAVFPGHIELADRLITVDHHAASSGLATAARSAHIDRLPSDDGSDRLAHVHGIGIHHPGHGLLVGVYVRGGNVFFRAKEFNQLSGVAAGKPFQFSNRKLLRINDDAAFGATKRNIDDCAFPRHPACQGANFIKSNVRRIAHAALSGTAGDGVLNTESGVDLQPAIVHCNGDMNNNFAVRITENFPEAFIKVELLGGKIKTSCLGLPGVQLMFQR